MADNAPITISFTIDEQQCKILDEIRTYFYNVNGVKLTDDQLFGLVLSFTARFTPSTAWPSSNIINSNMFHPNGATWRFTGTLNTQEMSNQPFNGTLTQGNSTLETNQNEITIPISEDDLNPLKTLEWCKELIERDRSQRLSNFFIGLPAVSVANNENEHTSHFTPREAITKQFKTLVPQRGEEGFSECASPANENKTVGKTYEP